MTYSIGDSREYTMMYIRHVMEAYARAIAPMPLLGPGGKAWTAYGLWEVLRAEGRHPRVTLEEFEEWVSKEYRLDEAAKIPDDDWRQALETLRAIDEEYR